MTERFYFEAEGDVHGPIPAQLLEGLARAGLLPLSTPIHVEGGSQWITLDRIMDTQPKPVVLTHSAPKENVEDIFRKTLRPSEDFFCSPRITSEHLKSVCDGYLKMTEGEILLAVYDSTKIFVRMCRFSEYHPNEVAISVMHDKLKRLYERRDHTFGNARLVRNTFEKALSIQASRLIRENTHHRESLTQLLPLDIPEA